VALPRDSFSNRAIFDGGFANSASLDIQGSSGKRGNFSLFADFFYISPPYENNIILCL
jgi:hypothetical protein